MDIALIGEIIEKWGVIPLIIYVIMQQQGFAGLKTKLPEEMQFFRVEIDKIRRSVESLARNVKRLEEKKEYEESVSITEIIATDRDAN